MTAFIERIMYPVTLLLQILNSHLGHLYPPFSIRCYHLGAIAGIVFLFFFLIPAGVLTYLEPEWNYLDALYYCFISLTTIGLGDYIPGDSPQQVNRPLYKICTTGMAIIYFWTILHLILKIDLCFMGKASSKYQLYMISNKALYHFNHSWVWKTLTILLERRNHFFYTIIIGKTRSY